MSIVVRRSRCQRRPNRGLRLRESINGHPGCHTREPLLVQFLIFFLILKILFFNKNLPKLAPPAPGTPANRRALARSSSWTRSRPVACLPRRSRDVDTPRNPVPSRKIEFTMCFCTFVKSIAKVPFQDPGPPESAPPCKIMPGGAIIVEIHCVFDQFKSNTEFRTRHAKTLVFFYCYC